MGGELVDQETSHVSYTEVFDEQFPYYLSMGMSTDEYWNSDSALTTAYRKAYKLKWEDRNRALWLQGEYIYEALVYVAPIFNAMSKKGTKAHPYPSEPHDLFPDKPKKNIVKNKEDKMFVKMQAFAEKFNKRFKNKQKGGGLK